MDENIYEFITMGAGAIVAALAIASFMMTQLTIEAYFEYRQASDYYRTNSTAEYEDVLYGYDLVLQIMNDDDGIQFIVEDSLSNEIINVTNCSDVGQLVSIIKANEYDVAKSYVNGQIIGITYKQR